MKIDGLVSGKEGANEHNANKPQAGGALSRATSSRDNAGTTWSDDRWGGRHQNVEAGGLGLRYEFARKHGLHMGMDLAWGTGGAGHLRPIRLRLDQALRG